ncbi:MULTISPECIES: FtsW/RodA/SpoVE family cell cycle protein [unclassified Pseudonocardia]|uniref:FtsW/RodA/SpoVE family cell cycle protein n=1 Tax=unclassified Pseudonocardia TaxID=2619320 RepID=UPI00095E2F61|nr:MULTISPECIES: FtsW/RodA/SpoVE family cell cycle protein [unclassified Pseudonocardia]MBN9101602.1 FtsW/RodA/SpoVE family cell cycle protein [Pseudonocardia sp.]OJY44722.1 MAG: cell division protein FtsW [Pseudonocardia sp. 73-21]
MATATDGHAPARGPGVPPSLPTGRSIELVLLAFSAVIFTGALVLVEANQEQQLTPSLLWVGLAYLGLFTIGHFAVRRFAPFADPLILPCVALLNGLGLVMIHRLDLAGIASAAAAGDPAPTEALARQVAWTAIGMVLFIAVLGVVRDHRILARYAYTAGFAGLVLLALPGLLPSSLTEVNGAKIWLRFGIFSIQPGEFSKILLIVFFAAFLVQKRELFTTAGRRFLGMEFPRPRDLAPLLVAWGLSIVVLVLESDLGTSLLFFGIVLVLLYAATERVSWMVIGLTIFMVGAYVSYLLFARVKVRVQVWLDPFADANGAGYQIVQALFGLGTGGVGGTGLGAGRPDIVPFANSDFMLSSLGEELGLIGLAAILVIYLVLITRGLRSALAVRDSFGKLLATGLSFALALQVFIVVGGVSKLIPLTGLTLPFLSYGGSSLVANYALVALLLRVSNAARAPLPRRPATPAVPLAEAGTEMVERPS